MIKLSSNGGQGLSYKIPPFTLPDMGEGNFYNQAVTHNLNSLNLIIELYGDVGGGNWGRLQDSCSSSGLNRGYTYSTNGLNSVTLRIRYQLDFGYPPYLVKGSIIAL